MRCWADTPVISGARLHKEDCAVSTEQFELQLHIEAPAIHFLNDSVADFLLDRGHAVKIGEIVSQVGKPIGASAKLIRQTLSTDEQFVGEERRWNLALRTSFHRPLEGALQHTLRLFGKPMSLDAISNEMAALHAHSVDYFQDMLPAFLQHRTQTFFIAPDGCWGLNEWLLDIITSNEEELLLRNFFIALDEVRPLLDEVRRIPLTAEMSYTEMAQRLLTTSGRPLSTKVMSFAIWLLQHEDFAPLDFYLALYEQTEFHLLSGGEWIHVDQLPAMTVSLQKLSLLADAAVEEDETWEGPYVVSLEDRNEIFDFLLEHGRAQRLTDLIEAIFEYSKNSPHFPTVFEGLTAALHEDTRFQAVGLQTWALPALVPQEVLQVPDSLLPETLDPTLVSDPEADAELEDEGLESKLALWVHDPRYEDFGGEHEVELSPELMSEGSALDETRVPLLYNHRKMGTLKLRQADMSFFPTDTPLACVTLKGEQFGPFLIWINSDELLIHGLADWYQARHIPVGAALSIQRTNEQDEFLLSWDGECDELIAIAEERISALLNYRDQASEENWSVFDIMRTVLQGHPEGMHFLTLWAEVNVVRRTPKRVVASNLSSYHCFILISGTERWKLDERKIEQGRKKTKKKFIIE